MEKETAAIFRKRPFGEISDGCRLLGEVAGNARVVCSHGIGAFFPIHRADFAVLFEVLERIDDTEAFADGAAKRHIVDHLVADDTLEINQEQTTVGDEFSGDDGFAFFVDAVATCEDVVVFGNGFVDVGNEGVGNAFDTAFFLRSLKPSPV